jgi:hypothetical protein
MRQVPLHLLLLKMQSAIKGEPPSQYMAPPYPHVPFAMLFVMTQLMIRGLLLK